MQTQPAAAAAKAVYDARGRTFRRFCRRNSAGAPRRHALGHAVRPNSRIRFCPALWHASVSGLGRALTGSGKPWPGARSTGQKPYTIPGALLRRLCRRSARRAGFDAAGAEGQRPTLVYDSCFESGGYEKTPAGNTQREAF